MDTNLIYKIFPPLQKKSRFRGLEFAKISLIGIWGPEDSLFMFGIDILCKYLLIVNIIGVKIIIDNIILCIINIITF